VSDTERFLARRVTHASLSSPKHENGLACLGRVSKTKTRSPAFERLKAFPDDGEITTEVRSDLESIRPWLEAMRDCSDSALVVANSETQPFKRTPLEVSVHLLHHATRVELLALAETSEWSHAVRLCAATLEVSRDLSYLGVDASRVAGSALRGLLSPCARALAHLDATERQAVAPRFMALATRGITAADLAEAERLWFSLSAFSGFVDADLRFRLPPIETELQLNAEDWFPRLIEWRAMDPMKRRVVEAASVGGPGLTTAINAYEERLGSWWMPRSLEIMHQDYGRLLARHRDDEAMLQVLMVAVAGGTDYPPQVSRGPAGLAFTFFDGKTLEIPNSSQ
jgi:hypothetical protein